MMLTRQAFEDWGAHLKAASNLYVRPDIMRLTDGRLSAFTLTTEPRVVGREVAILRAETAVQRNEGIREAFSAFGALCIMGVLLVCLPVLGMVLLVADGARRLAW